MEDGSSRKPDDGDEIADQPSVYSELRNSIPDESSIDEAIVDLPRTDLLPDSSVGNETAQAASRVKAPSSSDEELARTNLRASDNQVSRDSVIAARKRELEELGFSPGFIASYPDETLVGANTSVRKRLKNLSYLGFDEPVKLIERYPTILSFAPENISDKLDSLKSLLGIDEPDALIKLIKRNPGVLTLSIENIRETLDTLQLLGFSIPIDLVKFNPGILGLKPETIEGRFQNLKSLGFDPIKVIKGHPSVINLTEENIAEKIDALKSLGFSRDLVKLIEAHSGILILDSENIKSKLENLKLLGFDNPVEIIKVHPGILGFAPNKIKSKLETLKLLGFENPVNLISKNPKILSFGGEKVEGTLRLLEDLEFGQPTKLIEAFPNILSLSEENIKLKFANLESLNFNNPIKLVERYPGILGLSPKYISDKLAFLSSLGFDDPVRVIEGHPSLIALKEETIYQKIDFLGHAGFKDRTKLIELIERKPTILALSEKNIKRKIKLTKRLIEIFNSPIDPIRLLEEESSILLSKLDKLLVLARIAERSESNPSEIDKKIIHDILFSNLEDILIALDEVGSEQNSSDPIFTIQQLLARAREIKKMKISKEDKRAMIKGSSHIPSGVGRRYFKGYPLK